MKLSSIKPNPSNPRTIKDESFKKLCNSIEQFPKMMALRPMVIDSDGVILGGNMRFKALQHLGFKEVPDEWVKRADELTEEERKRFIIADNVSGGDWDVEDLSANWDVEQLEAWGLELDWPTEQEEDQEQDSEALAHQKLQERFIVPPFSILDTRQGYWQERKRYWRELIGDNGESRIELLGSGGITIDDNSKSWLHNPKLGNGVSILDPVLAEIVNLWFGFEKCKTFDCFAGDSVFGYVSSYLGNQFTGIELRKEQAELNNQRIKGFASKYICDDGQNVLNHIERNSQDLLFSCPPYFDLEVYSDLPNDASNQKEYKDFLKILDNAFTGAIKCLKDNRFAVITVGDIRDKKGFYYRFVDDIKDIFKRNGVNLYNELILTEAIAFAAIRASGNMDTRKITKCHQNVLVFFKGDPKQIKIIYPKIEVQDASEDMA
jgi:DNA modification methylase